MRLSHRQSQTEKSPPDLSGCSLESVRLQLLGDGCGVGEDGAVGEGQLGGYACGGVENGAGFRALPADLSEEGVVGDFDERVGGGEVAVTVREGRGVRFFVSSIPVFMFRIGCVLNGMFAFMLVPFCLRFVRVLVF